MPESAEPLDSGPACFKHRFSGEYKTFSPGDFAFTVRDWTRVHAGPCQCEGQSPPECIEPGDDS